MFSKRFFACFRRFARLTCLEPFQRRDPMDFPRCALKKECASIRHSETVAFMAWRFIFVCAIVLKDEKNQKMTERSLTRVFGSVFSCNV